MFLLKPDWEITVYFSFLFKHNIACFFCMELLEVWNARNKLAREHTIFQKKNNKMAAKVFRTYTRPTDY